MHVSPRVQSSSGRLWKSRPKREATSSYYRNRFQTEIFSPAVLPRKCLRECGFQQASSCQAGHGFRASRPGSNIARHGELSFLDQRLSQKTWNIIPSLVTKS